MMAIRICAFIVFGFTFDVLLPPAHAQGPDARLEFHIPSTDVEDALYALARASGRSLIIPSEQVDNIRSKPLSGFYTVSEALETMLKDTGLTSVEAEGMVIAIAVAVDSKTVTGEEMGVQYSKQNSKKSIKAALLSGVAALFGGIGALAQDAQDTENDKDEIIVTGIKSSLANAIEDKRNANNIIDGISAEGMANFPDLDLAEALQRVTGIQINRENRSRTGSVLIRGLPETFSLTTFNGQTLQPPQFDNNESQGTGFPLGILRSDVIGSVSVVKSLTAEHNIGGLSGIIDLQTRRPLESPEGMSLSVDGRYEPFAKSMSPGAGFALSRELVEDKVGVSLALGYQALDYRRDAVLVNIWNSIDGVIDALAPLEVRQSHSTFDGRQLSASGEVQWKPTDNLDLSVSGIYGNQNLYNTEQFLRVARRGQTTVTALSSELSDGSVRSIRLEDPLVWSDSRSFDEKWTTFAVSGRAKWESDQLIVDGGVNYTEGHQVMPTFNLLFASGFSVPTGAAFDIFTGEDGNFEEFAVVPIAEPSGSYADYFANAFSAGFTDISPASWDLPNRYGSVADPSFYMQIFGRNQEQNSSELSYDLNAEYFTEDTFLIESFKFGMKRREIKADQDSLFPTFAGLDPSNVNTDIITAISFDGNPEFYSELAGPNVDAWYVPDLDEFYAQAGPIDTASLSDDLHVNSLGIASAVRDPVSYRNTYDVRRNISALYGMVNFGSELSGAVSFSGNIGGRYVSIDRDTMGYEFNSSLGTIPVESSHSFEKFLPSGNLSINLGDNVVLRVAGSQSVVPPNPIDFIANILVDATILDSDDPAAEVDPAISVTLGATDLDPFSATNFDIALEWYNRAGSMIALTAFQKTVDAEPVSVFPCPLDGGNLGLGELQYITSGAQVGCFLADTPAGFTELVRVDIEETDTMSYKLQGLEFSVVQDLSFLPAPFDGLGAQFNYTLVDVVDGIEDLPQISKHTANVILFYETEKFAIRGAYNYRSDYFLVSNSTIFGLEDRITEARGQFDATISYNVTDNLSLQLEGFNLTNEPLVQTEGDESRLRRAEKYGRAALIAARYQF